MRRLGPKCLAAALGGVTLLSLAASPPAHACGIFGLFCQPQPAAPAPDPGGSESPDQPVPAPGHEFGFNSQLYVNRQSTVAQELDSAADAGATVHRLPVVWRMLQPTPSDAPVADTPYTRPYLERLDAFYAAALARGITPVFIAHWAPVWASRYRSCGLLDLICDDMARSDHKLVPDSPFLDEYEAFVRAVKSRWPRALIESWNEPNLYWDDPWYGGTRDFSASPEHFARIQCAAHRGSKAVNDDPVLAAGWAGRRYGDYVSRVYAAGGAGCWDIANLHIYPGEATRFGENTDVAIAFDTARTLRAKYGDADPIWVSEAGYSTSGELRVSQETQADASRRLYNRLVTMPDVEAVIFHTIRDAPLPGYPYNDSSHREYGFGFIREDWKPKRIQCEFAARAGNTAPGC